MSARSETKIFGMRLGLDPKFLVAGLIAVAALLFWYNSRSDDSPGGSGNSSGGATRSAVPEAGPGNVPSRRRATADRRRSSRDDRLVLRLQSVSPANGDIDPVLRLDLLERLAKVRPPSGMRNLFEGGPVMMGGASAIPVRHITPKPLPTAMLPQQAVVTTAIPQVNIPYKYYGFARPSVPGQANRGFFMEGDNILLATEGQLLQQRYKIVQLTPTSARVQDTQMLQEQTLSLVPQAMEGGSNASAYGQQQGFAQSPNQQGAMNPGYPNQPQQQPDENQP